MAEYVVKRVAMARTQRDWSMLTIYKQEERKAGPHGLCSCVCSGIRSLLGMEGARHGDSTNDRCNAAPHRSATSTAARALGGASPAVAAASLGAAKASTSRRSAHTTDSEHGGVVPHVMRSAVVLRHIKGWH